MLIDDLDTKSLGPCTVLGATGYPFVASDVIDLYFGYSALEIVRSQAEEISIPYVEVADILIGGPGATTSGGGFAGGGFGVSGALEGMGSAMVLNSLTTKTKIHTFISIVTNVGEVHCHYDGMEPSALRIELSEVFTTLRRQDPGWVKSRLDVLEARHSAKKLTDSELENLRQRAYGL